MRQCMYLISDNVICRRDKKLTARKTNNFLKHSYSNKSKVPDQCQQIKITIAHQHVLHHKTGSVFKIW